MLAVEDVAKSLGLWTDDDEEISGSYGPKSSGLAAIDFAVSNLKNDGLTHVGRNQWRVT